MSASRRFHLWLPADAEAAVRSYARAQGLGLAPAIRLLVRRSLELEAQRLETLAPAEPLAALAALIAAEHTVLMVASILPEGERRMRSLGERAAQAAEERLAQLRPQATDSGEECP
ncbi:MAG: hypothetical protein ACYDA0_11095 [Candidatus Dormibacteraceae bacterium]